MDVGGLQQAVKGDKKPYKYPTLEHFWDTHGFFKRRARRLFLEEKDT
jgi:hypothetical protein